METIKIIQSITSAVIAFIVGILITPVISNFLYKHKLWKKRSVGLTIDGETAAITQKLHNDEVRKTPRMGGVIVWGSVIITAIILMFLPKLFYGIDLSFLNRSQTWIPFAVFLGMSLVGLIDDYLVCQENHKAQGIPLRFRILLVALSGLAIAFWFYYKIDIQSIHIPFHGAYVLSAELFALFFVLVITGTYAGGVIDGIDGLAGGVFAIIFGAYGVIAFSMGMGDLAAFCLAITGALCAFLWFNIPPARFFLSDTGTMGLTTVLATIALITNTLLVLPILALPLVISVVSNIIQILSKKIRNKKVFLVAPLHNHFQALGWPSYKVTMRYWIITIMSALVGVILILLDTTYRP